MPENLPRFLTAENAENPISRSPFQRFRFKNYPRNHPMSRSFFERGREERGRSGYTLISKPPGPTNGVHFKARAGIGQWIDFYNHKRPHQAMSNQRPMNVWREGMDNRTAPDEAVDMTLRLDNANALTTYPQQPQKKQKKAA